MSYGWTGILLLVLAVFFHEKKWYRLRALSCILAFIFLTLAAITVWVGNFAGIG